MPYSRDPWVEALRKRSHDLANKLQATQAELAVLSQRHRDAIRRLESLESLAPTVNTLRQQAVVLRWILGILTAAAIATLSKLLA